MNFDLSVIEVNDIFDELSKENKRLLNYLLISVKCLNIFKNFKTFVDLVFNNYKIDFNSNDSEKYQKFNDEIERALNLIPTSDQNQVIIETDFKTELKENSETEDQVSESKIKLKKNTTKLKCDINGCHKTFSSKKLFNRHMKYSHSSHFDGNTTKLKSNSKEKSKSLPKYDKFNRRYKCDVKGCDFQTNNKHSFISHTNKHKGLKPFTCDYISCGKQFLSEIDVKYHIKKVHQMIRRLKCDSNGCDYVTDKTERLISHKNIVHKGIRPFKCSQCEATFGCDMYLKQHIHLVHETAERLSKCHYPGCGKSFKSVHYIKVHYNRVHLNIRSDKKFHCDVEGCQYRSEFKDHIRIHKTCAHSAERQFHCTVDGCLKAFKFERYLKEHIDIRHKGITMKCDKCGLSGFTSQSGLKDHLSKEHSNQVFHCDWPGCEYSAKLFRNLKKHQFVHKSEEDFACDWPECHKRFKRKAYLERHLMIHNNIKPYACEWPGCTYRSAVSGNLQKHRRVHQKLNSKSISFSIK